MTYGFDFNEIIEGIVAEQHKELLEKVAFWKNKAWNSKKDKEKLEADILSIQKKLSEKEKENHKAEVFFSILENLSEKEVLEVLKKSVKDSHKESFDTPIFMSLLLDNPEINKELIEKMKALGIKLPMNIDSFVHPTNYTKEQLLEIAKKKTNFYVTNGNLFSSNYSYFTSALKIASFRFEAEIESLPLQLLFKNKLFLDSEVFYAFLDNKHVSRYMFNLTKFHNMPYSKVLDLISATENKLEKQELLSTIKEYHDKQEVQELLLEMCETNKWSNVNIGLLTDENKVKFLKSKGYSLEKVVEICHDFKFLEETLQYIFLRIH